MVVPARWKGSTGCPLLRTVFTAGAALPPDGPATGWTDGVAGTDCGLLVASACPLTAGSLNQIPDLKVKGVDLGGESGAIGCEFGAADEAIAFDVVDEPVGARVATELAAVDAVTGATGTHPLTDERAASAWIRAGLAAGADAKASGCDTAVFARGMERESGTDKTVSFEGDAGAGNVAGDKTGGEPREEMPVAVLSAADMVAAADFVAGAGLTGLSERTGVSGDFADGDRRGMASSASATAACGPVAGSLVPFGGATVWWVVGAGGTTSIVCRDGFCTLLTRASDGVSKLGDDPLPLGDATAVGSEALWPEGFPVEASTGR